MASSASSASSDRRATWLWPSHTTTAPSTTRCISGTSSCIKAVAVAAWSTGISYRRTMPCQTASGTALQSSGLAPAQSRPVATDRLR